MRLLNRFPRFSRCLWSSLIWETVRIAWRASDMKCPRCTKRVAVWLLTLLLLQVSQAMCPKKALDKPRRGMVAVKSHLSDSTWSGSWNKPVDTVKQQGLMLWDWMQIDMSSNMLKLIVTRICLFMSWHYFPHFISSARQKRKTNSHVWKLIAPLVAIFGWLAFPKVYRQLLRNEAEMAADLRLMEDRSLKGFHVTGWWTSNMHVQAMSCFTSDFNECL